MADREIQILYDVADASWEPNSRALCQIVLSDLHIVKTVFDAAKQRFVSLYAEKLPGSDFETLQSRIQFILQNEHELTARCFLSVQKALLMPSVLYEEETKALLFRNHQIPEADESLETTHLKHLEADLIFAYPHKYQRLKNESAPGLGEFFSADAAWLDALSLNSKNAKGLNLHVNLGDGFISIAVFKEEALQFYNTFLTINPEEVLYYVMFVSEQFQMKPAEDMFYFSGYIQKTDSVYALLSKYIKNIKPEARPGQFSYSMPVIAIPEHMFIQAFSTPLCVS